MIKLRKGDRVVWWESGKTKGAGERHYGRVEKPSLPNQHGVPLDFTAVFPRPGGKLHKRFSQLDRDTVLLLAPPREWRTFLSVRLPDYIEVARIPGCAQPTYGLFNLNVAGAGWSQLHGLMRTEQEIPLEFWRHGKEEKDMAWCLRAGEQDVRIDWAWPVSGDLAALLRGVEIHEG
jgi:hypothetical protein